MKQFEINHENEGQRLDKYIGRLLSNAGMAFVYKMLRKKNFVLNDKKATGKEIIKAGDIVKLYISDDTFNKFKSNDIESITEDLVTRKKNTKYKDFDLKSRIVYEDKDILVINKPHNMLSQKASPSDISVNELIIDYLIDNKTLSKDDIINYKPSVVNRLDRNTTGLIIAAKNLKVAQILSENLKSRSIEKYYQCLVAGGFNKEGLYTAYLTKNEKTNIVRITDNSINSNSQRIETEYRLIEKLEECSTVEVHLITGKSHQIRAHLAYLGYPIIGDKKYGNTDNNKKYNAKYQQLHAYKIVFPNYSEDLDFAFSGKTIVCPPEFKY